MLFNIVWLLILAVVIYIIPERIYWRIGLNSSYPLFRPQIRPNKRIENNISSSSNSTGGNEQDVKAMLELYGDLIDSAEPQTDQETTRKTDDTT